MATVMNPFYLLENADVEDPSLLIQSISLKVVSPAAVEPSSKKAAAVQSKSSTQAKPLAPSQAAVREVKNEGGRGGGSRREGYGDARREGYGDARREGYGSGRGGGPRRYGRDAAKEDNSFNNAVGNSNQGGAGGASDGDGFKSAERRSYNNGPRGDNRNGPRGGGGFYRNEEAGDGERPKRPYERRSGTGRGNEVKREGSGRGNWGTQEDENIPVTEAVVEIEKNVSDEKPTENGDASMTLEEYEKIMGEKRKALQTVKSEERKVDAKEFESMQQLSNKKDNNDIFVKLGSEKDKKKEAYEKEEKAKKSVSINEFLKPAKGERYFPPGGRGRGAGRGGRGGYGGGDHQAVDNKSPFVAVPEHFPTLGSKK
ncbi:hypothetical protein ACFE04_016703 [Oxalis oulophora]